MKPSETKAKQDVVPRPTLIGEGAIEYLESDEAEVYQPSGLRELDDLILGAIEGELTLIAGPPSRGKTALAVQWMQHTAQMGDDTAIMSMEMTRAALRTRLIASTTGISMQDIRRRLLSPAQKATYRDAAEWIASLPLFVDDRGGLNPDKVYNTILAWKQWGVKLGVLDYIQQMGGDNESRVTQVGDAVRAIKAGAKDAKLPMIALSSVNRASASDNRVPKLSDLRDSGDLEFVADTILMFHYPEDDEHEDIRIADIHVLKQRNGPTGIVPVQLNKPATRFEERSL